MRYPVKIIIRKNDLRKSYLIRLEGSFILSLLIFVGITKVEIIHSQENDFQNNQPSEVFEVEEVIQTQQEIFVPPPPRPVVPVAVPNDEIIENEIIDIDAELNLGEVFQLPPPPAYKEEKSYEDDEIFIVVEQEPQLIGGLAAFRKKITYPEMARKAGIEGRVVVQFIIDREGNVRDPVVIRGIGSGCDEEALRAVKIAKFIPGKQRGKPVMVRFSLPVSFKLSNDND